MNDIGRTASRLIVLAGVLIALYLAIVIALNWDAVQGFSAIRD